MVGCVSAAVQSLWPKVRKAGEKASKSLFVIKISLRTTCLHLASVGRIRRWIARIPRFGALAIEDVIADRCRFCPADTPWNLNAAAVKIQCAAGRVVRWIGQQYGRSLLRPGPACRVARLVAFAVTPPGKLARRSFSSLVNDIAGCVREIRARHTI